MPASTEPAAAPSRCLTHRTPAQQPGCPPSPPAIPHPPLFPLTAAPCTDCLCPPTFLQGTGKWTIQQAAELSVAAPTMEAALDARFLSGLKDERLAAEAFYKEQGVAPPGEHCTGSMCFLCCRQLRCRRLVAGAVRAPAQQAAALGVGGVEGGKKEQGGRRRQQFVGALGPTCCSLVASALACACAIACSYGILSFSICSLTWLAVLCLI